MPIIHTKKAEPLQNYLKNDRQEQVHMLWRYSKNKRFPKKAHITGADN